MHHIPKNALFCFKTAKGSFWIAPQPGSEGRFFLGFEDDALGSFATPNDAASDVASHMTGLGCWDAKPSLASDPTDLGDWARVSG
ncbi:MAG: hypothetical protein AABZ53_08135 [Planctomycetota bacterium]